MARITYKSPASRLSAAHQALYESQEKKGRNYLSYSQAEKILRSAPGFTFGEGKSAHDLLQDLERFHFVTLDTIAERVFILSWDKKTPKKQLSRTQLEIARIQGRQYRDYASRGLPTPR